MRVPLSWLKEYVDISLSPEDLAELLTRSGLEVDSIERIGVPGAELPWDREKVLVANILEVRQHPNADRLVLADVDYGAEQPHTVVTGAPNLYQYKDQGRLPQVLKGVFAREGAELYDGHAEGKVKVKLKGRPVRGIMSDAMLCSEKELGLSEEHEGIIFLPDDAPVGMPLVDYLGDVVFEISILPNIARCLSIVGVAREVAALTGATLRLPDASITAELAPISERARLTVETPDLCPRFTLTLIEDAKSGTSPLWMQRRLSMAGMRPINTIVDISNYVMLELGQPNHTFDADKVADQHIIVRLAHPGETLTTLDGKQQQLDAVGGTGSPALLVCDPEGPLSVAGVMGGESSEIGPDTTRILLEMAVWEPTIIRRMGTALRMRSEASRRFERGVDLELLPFAQQRALHLLQKLAGGKIAQGMLDVYLRPWQERSIDLTAREVQRILGLDLNTAQIAAFLEPLGFSCALAEDERGPLVRVTVPSFRDDCKLAADLCEEVARMYGYDRLPTTMLSDSLPPQRAMPEVEQEEKIRDLLVGAGLDEAITYSFTNMEEISLLDASAALPEQHLKLSNPLSSEREYLRRSLLHTLMPVLTENLNERERVLMFEIGRVYMPLAEQVLPNEPRRLAIILAGTRSQRSWLSTDGAMLDFFDLKGVVELVLERLGIHRRTRFIALSDDTRFHPGRAATLELLASEPSKGATHVEGRPVGVLGELHPAVLERLGIRKQRALAAEIDLDALIGDAQPMRYQPISRFPATTQDFSIIVGYDVPADRVAATIRKYAGNELESLTLIDMYEGKNLDKGTRSLTYSLAFRAKDRTLSDAELSKVRSKIIKGLEYDVKAVLRG